MLTIEGTLLDFRQLDQLAAGKSCIHNIDARIKILVTLIFIISVVSFNNHEISALLPFLIFPVAISSLGNLPLNFIFKKLFLVLPFALMIGIFNPLFDRTVLINFGPLEITGGWISCLSIIIRTILTVSAGLILVSVTGFTTICQALIKMKVPKVFAMQLLFLYRYIFILAEEVNNITTAHALRSFKGKRIDMATFIPLLGNLLVRTWERAERIHLAMLSRGYNGEFYSGKASVFSIADLLFLTGWSLLFIYLRLFNVSDLLGKYIAGLTA